MSNDTIDGEQNPNVNTDIDVATEDRMRDRANESRLKIWLLLRANRLYVAGVLAAAVFVLFVVLVAILPPPLAPQLKSGDTIETMFSTMIGAIITGVTLVVTIGQLVVSEENGPLGEQRDRMEDAMDFRDYTEEIIEAPSPADPSSFLREIVAATQRRADAVNDGLRDIDSDQLQWETEQITESIVSNSEEVQEQLENARFGTFDVLQAALNYNYAWKIYQLERLADDHEEDIGPPENQILSELRTALSLFGPAREHIKTLYFEWALVSLSQLILYAALPALVVAGVMLTVVDGGTLGGTILGIESMTWVIAAAFTVTLVPFLLFVSYVLRVVTVAKRTLAVEPLILRDSQR